MFSTGHNKILQTQEMTIPELQNWPRVKNDAIWEETIELG